MHAKSLVGWCLQADRGVYRKESRNMEDDFRRREERGGMDVCLSLNHNKGFISPRRRRRLVVVPEDVQQA